MKLVALAVEILGVSLASTGAENAAGTCGHGFFPVGNLHWVDVEILGDLLDGLDAFERFECYAGFEFGFVSLPCGLAAILRRVAARRDKALMNRRSLAESVC